MVEEIYNVKNEVLKQIAQEMREKGANRIDPQMVDMVKDLASAEKDCWEAEYYRSVAEAMQGGQMGYDGMYGAQMGNRGGMSQSGPQNGSQSGYRDSMGRYARRGYGMGYQEHLDALKMEMQNADPQERERMMRELKGIM